MREYIDTFTSGLEKLNFWNQKQDTKLVLGHGCHIEFGLYGRCASLAPLIKIMRQFKLNRMNREEARRRKKACHDLQSLIGM